jgi:two-component system sensor histidine kinase KdpD
MPDSLVPLQILALLVVGALAGGALAWFATGRRGRRRNSRLTRDNEAMATTNRGQEQGIADRELEMSEHEHEMKGNLAVILGWSYLLRDAATQPKGEQLDDIHDRILRSGESLRHQVDSMLHEHRSRIEMVQAQWREFDLTIKVTDLCSDFEHAVTDHTLTWHLEPSCRVVSSEYGIEQIFGHLVDNATKYSPPGTPITIALRRERDVIELSVADAGPGFPPDLDLRVPFVQGQATNRPEGVGLGLFIAESWASALRGEITLVNAPQGGAVASLRIPVDAS